MKNSDVIIDMQGITKAFQGVVALDDVSLTAYKGEIRALIGENGAGKSTLMNILNGSLKQDYGTITYKGKQISYKSTAEAIQNGISMVHQEITLVPEMNVAENIWMGRENMFRGTLGINWDSCYKKTQELLDKLSIKINPHSMISNLTVAQTQLVEIARAVSYNSDIIIMDEPTSSLSDNETELLFSIMKNLAQNGCTIIFISHKIDEIFRICDTVTVMRDGKTIATEDCSDITPDILIQQIVGRKVSNLYPKESHFTDEVVLSVKGLSSPGIFSDVSFELKKGEILGFSGLIGAGRTEIMNAIFGLDKYAAGEVYVHGKRIDNKKTKAVIKSGIGMVTEDRLRSGIIKTLSVLQNGSIASLDKLSSEWGVIRRQKEESAFNSATKPLSIKYSSETELIGNLSGGNQQKVLISRWLMSDTDILILDEPTRGIDIGAKAEIYKLMNDLTKQGMSIILISSELPEVMAMSDRIMVIRDGQIVLECLREEATQEKIMKNAFGVEKKA
ncbi:MAG: sugar ABC transporter ATP-binding protein [Lachnospiraceae bacterium]|nr:sugar ABC transporter ATP-binding protein [Lachnospiraceae bacterium]